MHRTRLHVYTRACSCRPLPTSKLDLASFGFGNSAHARTSIHRGVWGTSLSSPPPPPSLSSCVRRGRGRGRRNVSSPIIPSCRLECCACSVPGRSSSPFSSPSCSAPSLSFPVIPVPACPPRVPPRSIFTTHNTQNGPIPHGLASRVHSPIPYSATTPQFPALSTPPNTHHSLRLTLLSPSHIALPQAVATFVPSSPEAATYVRVRL
ncbi:hypothetical protein L226DRAFT_152861 [Lentinus tigrinus ALCF2SS1-7]|uniref:uncharacterized protein n=1 Tax=Lentinus tigrinus ALCF2SS1-7 TaxID=1328758 RepID=UPI00116616D2|nr:hypothetical protein L226DRAFT_152861 [Lentinus tigrinus ALCF2SS1-7]